MSALEADAIGASKKHHAKRSGDLVRELLSDMSPTDLLGIAKLSKFGLALGLDGLSDAWRPSNQIARTTITVAIALFRFAVDVTARVAGSLIRDFWSIASRSR